MDQTTPTSKIAGATHAATTRGRRRRQVLARLQEQPSTLWEIARQLGVADHQISGVFTALCADGFIERSGDRRNKPETGCPADVWRIRGAAWPVGGKVNPTPDSLAMLGYPITLTIDGELYDRQALLPDEGYPGVPYARRADRGGARLLVRVELIECPHCGRPQLQTDPATKSFSCGAADCGYVFRAKLVQEPGHSPLLAMVKMN